MLGLPAVQKVVGHMGDDGSSTRDRLLSEALRLFGENGYKATRVAEIENAAGLAPGRGGLYRHFASKRELLIAAVTQEADRNRELLAKLSPAPNSTDPRPTPMELAWAGLQRLRQERDLNRLVLRGLADSPELLELAVQTDIGPVHRSLEAWLRPQLSEGWDAAAFAAVLAGAITHFWLLEDVFGQHPTGVTAEAYIATLASLCSEAFTPRPDQDRQTPLVDAPPTR